MRKQAMTTHSNDNVIRNSFYAAVDVKEYEKSLQVLTLIASEVHTKKAKMLGANK